MRSLTTIFLISIITSSLAVTTTTTQLKFKTDSKASAVDKLNNAHLGRALLGMAEMHGKLGYALDDLYDALNLLRDNLKQKIVDENADYDADETEKDATQAKLQGKVDKYTADLAIYNGELTDLVTQATDLNNEKTRLAKAFANAKSSEADYKQKLEDLDAKHA